MTPFVHAEPVMGTVVTFDVRRQPPAVAVPAIECAVAWLHWVDAAFSTYRSDSEINRLDRGDLTLATCHPEVRHILRLCDELHDRTYGYFDARAGGHLDPSGVVKGWSIERASTILASTGCPDHVIDGGGDVRCRGRTGTGHDWHVGVVHPLRLDAYCAALHLDQGAVATSGTYERGFHVINPHRRQPAKDLASATVVGPDLTLADAYATAALAMGKDAPEWLRHLESYEALVVYEDGGSWESPGFSRYRMDLARQLSSQISGAGGSPGRGPDRRARPGS
jgi:thiamine biosynthesis lipoprotein